MIKHIKDLKNATEKQKTIISKINSKLTEDVMFLEKYLPELTWHFKPSEDEVIKFFYPSREGYGCFEIHNWNYHIFFSNQTHKFYFLRGDLYLYEGDNYDELWDVFTKTLEKHENDVYNKYVRLLKLYEVVGKD